MRVSVVDLVGLAAVVGCACGFYLPGLAPKEYKYRDNVQIVVSSLRSAEDVPRDYQFTPLCGYKGESRTMNFGDVLEGKRDKVIDYDVKMNVGESCKVLCINQLFPQDFVRLRVLIEEGYRLYFEVDDLPVTVVEEDEDGKVTRTLGVPLGHYKGSDHVVYNHIDFKILFNVPSVAAKDLRTTRNDERKFRVVGFEANYKSLRHLDAKKAQCDPAEAKEVDLEHRGAEHLVMTYSVKFEQSEIEWATRWDSYVRDSFPKSLRAYLLMSAILICTTVTLILVAVLRRRMALVHMHSLHTIYDLAVLEQGSINVEALRADVLRSPPGADMLAALVGSGSQICLCLVATMVMASIGYHSPASRGPLLVGLLVIWVLTSVVCGYVSAIVYKAANGKSRGRTVLLTSLMFPGTIFTVFFLLNGLLIAAGSTGVVHFSTMVLLLVLWFGMSVPLNITGAFFAYRMSPTRLHKFQGNINTTPAETSNEPLKASLKIALIPFAVSVEAQFVVLHAPANGLLYLLLGFFCINMLVISFVSIEVGVITADYLFRRGHHSWWWTAFMSSAWAGVYCLCYSLCYVLYRLIASRIYLVSAVSFATHAAIACLSLGTALGSLSFLAAYRFVLAVFK